ncbi:MAG TPA: hypothetical protein VFZ27_19155, partial [Terriglobia bacterium]|nr:hypothetical protein [Terriglobia bacterium]
SRCGCAQPADRRALQSGPGMGWVSFSKGIWAPCKAHQRCSHASAGKSVPSSFSRPLRDIAEVWRRGSVVASWLLDLTAAALVKDPALSEFAGHVSDSGEGPMRYQFGGHLEKAAGK